MNYLRELDLSATKSSAFLFGPRMTGKTFLLKNLRQDLYVNLLDPDEELSYKVFPKRLWEELKVLKNGSVVIVDEVQRVPALLDYVQMGIEQKNLRFLLSGSSARKLKRGGANLLGGRAADLHLHPLTLYELGSTGSISQILEWGSLPKISSLLQENENDAFLLLKSYVTTYLKEEIQAEALVRKLDTFQRFFDVAVQSNAQMIEYSNISRECSVPASTVKEYYQILEDTLLGLFLWPFDRSERKKARPKFYFFDSGVIRAVQGQLRSKPTAHELGFLFETWFVQELHRIRDYKQKQHRFSLWREGEWEIDLLVEKGRGFEVAFECKSGKEVGNQRSIQAFRTRYPNTPLIIVSLRDERKRKLENGAEIWPYADVLEFYRSL